MSYKDAMKLFNMNLLVGLALQQVQYVLCTITKDIESGVIISDSDGISFSTIYTTSW